MRGVSIEHRHNGTGFECVAEESCACLIISAWMVELHVGGGRACLAIVRVLELMKKERFY